MHEILSLVLDPIFNTIGPPVRAWFEAWLWVPWVMSKLGAPDILCVIAFFGGSVGIPAFVLCVVRKPLLWLMQLTGMTWLLKVLFTKPRLQITRIRPDGSEYVEYFDGTVEQFHARERARQAVALQAKPQS